MRPTVRFVAVACVSAIVAGAAALVSGPGSREVVLAVLGSGVLLGELLELCPPERAAMPLSYAVVLVLLRAATPGELVVTVAAAEIAAAVLRDAPSISARLGLFAQRSLAALAALGVYRGVVDVAGSETKWVVLLALAGAGIAELTVDGLVHYARTRDVDVSWHGRSAQLALITSGMLMAVGYAGLEGSGAMGLWGPAVFSVPLLAAWYSFERLASIRRAYTQTLRALSVVPELGGLVREGHAARVAALSVALGREIGLDRRDVDYLEAAALLHHLGHLCLDDPEVLGRPIEANEVAAASAAMLRETEFLAPAGDLLAPDAGPFGGANRSAMSTGGQVLRVASAFDELSEGDAARGDDALEALYSGPGYVYDPRVLGALERVLERTRPVDVPA